jgi:hypothetical protein
MPSLNGLDIYQIWELKQIQSQTFSIPPQPLDNSKDLRLYLIIGIINNNDLVTCCPIQNSDKGIYGHEVALEKKINHFLDKDCKVICSSIFTLPDLWFTAQRGTILDSPTIDKIKNHTKRYLKLP